MVDPGAPLGLLFPAGGRVSPEQMVGREGDIADLVERLREFAHVVLSGPRRAGKTSVCGAACAVLRDAHDFIVIELEAPAHKAAQPASVSSSSTAPPAWT